MAEDTTTNATTNATIINSERIPRIARVNRRGSATTAASSLGRTKSQGPPTTSTSSAARKAPASRTVPKRCHTSGGERKSGSGKLRKKKKGIRVAITIRKEDDAPGINDLDLEELKKDGSIVKNLHQMEVHTTGKFSRKSCWPDVDSFWNHQDDTTPNIEINKDTMCDLLEQYSELQYPERKGADNLRPKRCYLQDCHMRGISLYKDYDWDPVKLNLRSRTDRKNGPVEITEQWTRHVKLEEIPLMYGWGTTDINAVLIQQGDKSVTSTLTKSRLQGHPLAAAMMTSDTQIVTEFRGLEAIVGVLGNDDLDVPLHDVDEETGDHVWRDVKSLRALLHDKELPPKEGKGSTRVLEVVALETYLKARVYYKAFFEGEVVSDHGTNLLLGERWWAHPLKDIMMGFNVENGAHVYEDIELRFFSEIGYKMDNEYFDWENQKGKWVKVPKKGKKTVTS